MTYPVGLRGRQPKAGKVTLDVINGPGSFPLCFPHHVASSILVVASNVARVVSPPASHPFKG